MTKSATAIVAAVRAEQSAVVSLHAVHAIVTSSRDRELLRKVNDFDVIAPDGQPVRWALNRSVRRPTAGPRLRT